MHTLRRKWALVAFALAGGAFATACVDGTTPDCSKINCGPATTDAAVVDDSSVDAPLDAIGDATDGSTLTDAAKSDATVDAKTD